MQPSFVAAENHNLMSPYLREVINAVWLWLDVALWKVFTHWLQCSYFITSLQENGSISASLRPLRRPIKKNTVTGTLQNVMCMWGQDHAEM